MVPDRGDVARYFAHDLRELRKRVGQPSYSDLQRLTRGSNLELHRATMSDILNGNRVKLPGWKFTAAFADACRSAAMESRLDVRDLPALRDWERHWQGAYNLECQSVPDQAAFVDWRRRWNDVFTPAVDIGPGAGWQQLPAGPGPGGAPAPAPHRAAAPDAPPAFTDEAGDAPAVTVRGRVPARLADFAGRDEWLARVHDAVGQGGARPVVIQGLCGTGKTQLVIEYAYRYASAYDLTWWVPGGEMDAALAAMADLELALGLRAGPRDPGPATAGEPGRRLLLIFDDADGPDKVRRLVPALDAHILVTSRNSRWESAGEVLELGPFTREESVAFLRRHWRGLSLADAHRLAEGTGDLPLVLEHAVESRISVDEYLARLEAGPLALLDSQPAGYQATVARAWHDAIAQLSDASPEAMRLLRCLSFFGPGGISLDWLEQGSRLPGISIHPLLRDEMRRGRAIAALGRAGLLSVHTEGRVLEVHEITRRVVRELVAQAGTADEQRYRNDVHLLLAAADPLYPDEPEYWRGYDQLRRHAVASDIESSLDEGVRELAINLVRSLVASGHPDAALSQADRALRRWPADSAHRTMRLAKAEALLACGLLRQGVALQREATAEIGSAPGGREREAFWVRPIVAAGHRIAGEFTAGEAADREAARAHAERFGHDYPVTFRAVNNVVTDLALLGDYDAALVQAERVHAACLAFHGEPGHPGVLFLCNTLARCLWLRGRYAEAEATMAGVHEGFRDLAASGVLDEGHPWFLAHEADLAVIRRDAGPGAASPASVEASLRKTWRRGWQRLGPSHPQTLAAAVALAAIVRRDPARDAEAIELLADAERRYQAVLPGHPFALACTGYLATLRRQAESADVLRDAIAGLERSVGERHPLTLAATAGLANVLADTGDLEEALRRGRQALSGFRERLGPGHPHVLACEANITTMTARLEQGEAGQLVDIDFTPLPL